MYNNLNRYEQALVDAFVAMVPQIIASDSLISFEHVQIECAQHLLAAAYRSKRAPRSWTCATFGKDRHWLNKK